MLDVSKVCGRLDELRANGGIRNLQGQLERRTQAFKSLFRFLMRYSGQLAPAGN